MDEYVFKFIDSKFNEIRQDLHDIKVSLKAHIEKDEHYWRKIDAQEAQLNLIKYLFSGTTIIGILTVGWAWITARIGF